MSFYSEASLAYVASAGAGKDGKAYSMKPVDGTGDFIFSRGSNLAATRVGPTGLIEKGRENLFTYSNDFSNAAWTKTEGTILGGQTGYDGGSDAWLYTDNVGTISKSHDVRQSVSESGVNCFSIYAKMGTKDWVKMYNGLNTCFFNIDPNYVGNRVGTDNTGGGRVEDVGNGWFRLSIFDNGSASLMLFGIAGGDGTGNYISDGTGTIYIQDAQLEIGLAATDYIESGATTGKAGLLENEPRFDYSGGATCPSLLLEPSRTQYIRYTEYLDPVNTPWDGFPTADPVTHSQNYAIAPDGTKTASLLGNFTSGGLNIVNNSNYRTPTDVTQNPLDDTYTMSVWLKTTSGTGTISLLNRGLSSGTNAPQLLQCNVTNEWQRFDVSNTYTAAEGASSLGFTIIKANPDTLEEVLVWGAQTEAGSYPTSYIPNHSGGSVTRGEDACVLTGASSIIGQTSGSIYFEFNYEHQRPSSYLFEARQDANNKIYLLSLSDFNLRFRGSVGGVGQFSVSTSSIPAEGVHKACLTYEEDNFAFYLDGALVGTATSGLISTTDELEIFTNNNDTNQFLLFDSVLSSADAITLTTL